ncbi:N-acetylglucosamine-6-phosphate deacetylase [Pseudonocardia sichuanensis]
MLGGARVIAPDGVLDPGWVEVDGARIARVGAGAPPRVPDHDLAGSWVTPGFVDIHVHGGGGAGFADGPDAARRVVAHHRRNGTTTMLASLVSAPIAALERDIAHLAELVQDGELAGVHLEGPFLSAARCGAHDPAALRPPERADVARLLRAGGGAVRMVTLAPELPGGPEAVRAVVAAGAVAAVGHTDATYAVTRTAVEAGARVATHLFNGMPGVHHREPGPVAALLEDERVVVELICDGAHLHPAVVRAAARAAGPDRVALVTDAVDAAGVGEGTWTLGGRRIHVEDGVARLADGSSLAGSTLSTSAALRGAVGAGIPLVDAVRALTATPAAVLGLPRVGALRAGYDADLVVLDAELGVRRVLAKGEWVA